MKKQRSNSNEFHVSSGNALLGSLVHNHKNFWLKMGDLESKVLRKELDGLSIDRPVFIAGLARSGSTILLELLSRFEGVCTHRYRDFPPVFTPFWWNWLVDRSLRQNAQPTERAHGDRIQVTPESPEAFEEPLWMAFFPWIHDASKNNVLDGKQRYPAFERFYRDHILKLQMVRRGTRYVSKGNYNISRIKYLQTIFPDARFVIPVREPAAHVASLIKQHKLFCEACTDNERAREHLRWVGHFEFGPDRTPINMGDTQCIDGILRLWANGDEVRGLARYWSHIYGTVAQQLENDKQLRDAALVIRYEEFCRSPAETVGSIAAHTGFKAMSAEVEDFCKTVSPPSYYKWPYSDNDLEIIREETSASAARLGYS